MSSNLLDLTLTGTLVRSAALNVVQMREIGSLRAAHPRPSAAVLSGISAETLEGKPARIEPRPGARPLLLDVFSSQCGWCTRNHAAVEALAAEVRSRFRVVGLSLDRQGCVPVNPSRSGLAAYDLAGTPATLVVSPDGRIARAWRGAYVGQVKADIERCFGVTLPAVGSPATEPRRP